jgi:methylated-DNA-[protein]-cysteine S-methyltransferase
MQELSGSLDTPLGRYALAATAEGIAYVAPPPRRRAAAPANAAPDARARRHLAAAEEALRAYFEGSLRSFESLRLAPQGGAFFQRVWQALREIPFGETVSYGELARAIGHPSAARAVGLANGRNPIAIIVPCHRVIGANGSLTGYAGGLTRKRWLLEHERDISSGQGRFSDLRSPAARCARPSVAC